MDQRQNDADPDPDLTYLFDADLDQDRILPPILHIMVNQIFFYNFIHSSVSSPVYTVLTFFSA